MTADLHPTQAPASTAADDAPPLPMMVVQRVEDVSALVFDVKAEIPCAVCGHMCAIAGGAHRQILERTATPTCVQCAETHYRGDRDKVSRWARP